jgi:hypothetical protein
MEIMRGGVRVPPREEEKKMEPNRDPDDKIMVYFHGNSEDVGHNIYFLMRLREMFGMSILAMEYPGYGFYSH